MLQDALSEVVDDITALLKERKKKEIAEVAKKVKEEVEKKGLKL